MPRKLPHYLRNERRRAALTQADLASLLGDRTASRVSRYERGRRLPPLRTALAYEAIFGIPVADLFGGSYDAICRDVAQRARRLGRDLRPSRNGALLARRKESLQSILLRC